MLIYNRRKAKEIKMNIVEIKVHKNNYEVYANGMLVRVFANREELNRYLKWLQNANPWNLYIKAETKR